MSTITTARSAVGAGIDPRGPRFAASLTSVVLAAGAGHADSRSRSSLLAAQAVVFAIGAARGVQHTPYAWLFRTLVRPRLGAPGELEDPRPPRFAQAVGLGFAVVGLVGFLAGAHGSSGWSPPGSRSRRPCSTRSSASAWAARSTCSSGGRPPADHPTRTRAETRRTRKVRTDEPRHRSRLRPVGGGPSRRPEGRPRRGRRGHRRLRQGPHQGRHQARLDHRPAGPGAP